MSAIPRLLLAAPLALLFACGGTPAPQTDPPPAAPADEAPVPANIAAALPHLDGFATAAEGLAAAAHGATDCPGFAAAVKAWAAPYATARIIERRVLGDDDRIVSRPFTLPLFDAMGWSVIDQVITPDDRQHPAIVAVDARYAAAVQMYGAAPTLERCAADPQLPETMGREALVVLNGLPEGLDALYQPVEYARALADMTTLTDRLAAGAVAVKGTADCAGLRRALDGWLTADGTAITAAVQALDDASFPWQDDDVPAATIEQVRALDARYVAALADLTARIQGDDRCDGGPAWAPLAERLDGLELVRSLAAFD